MLPIILLFSLAAGLEMRQATSTVIVDIGTPTITSPATLPTPSCNENYGRNCDRLPEQPYYFYVNTADLTNSFYGFTVPSFRDPWLRWALDPKNLNASSEASISATHCAAVWANSTSDYKASAPITSATTVPQQEYTTTLTPFTSVYTEESKTGTGPPTTVTLIFTETFNSTATTETDIHTDTDPFLYGTFTSTTIQTASGVVTSTYAGYTAYFYEKDFTFVPPKTCCSACTLFGGSIEIGYWPATQTASDAPSTLVNDAGFTFTSPSVYIALQTLSATDLCGEVGSQITAGTTLSFAPGKLSTAIAFSSNSTLYEFSTGWAPSDFTLASFGATECTDITSSFYMLGTDGAHYTDPVSSDPITESVGGTLTSFTNIFTRQAYTLTYNPCKPYLSVPPEIYAVDPLWTRCETWWQGFALFDPPYTFTPGKGLSGFPGTTTTSATAQPITSADPVTTSTTAADPGPTLPTVTPTPTVTLVPVSPTPDPTTVDPTSADSTPVDPTTVDPTTPVDPTVVDPTPVDPTPVNSSPVDPTPVDPTPVDPTPVNPTQPAGNDPGTSPTAIPTPADPGTQSISDPTTPAPVPAPTFAIGTQTLAPGGPAITVSGTVLSLDPAGSSVLVNNTPQPITDLVGPTDPAFVVGSQTLVAGAPAITLSGTPVSLVAGGGTVVVGSSTEALSALLGSTTVTASESGLGGVIVSVGGFETGVPGSGSNGTVPFLGGSERRSISSWMIGMGVIFVVSVVAWL